MSFSSPAHLGKASMFRCHRTSRASACQESWRDQQWPSGQAVDVGRGPQLRGLRVCSGEEELQFDTTQNYFRVARALLKMIWEGGEVFPNVCRCQMLLSRMLDLSKGIAE